MEGAEVCVHSVGFVHLLLTDSQIISFWGERQLFTSFSAVLPAQMFPMKTCLPAVSHGPTPSHAESREGLRNCANDCSKARMGEGVRAWSFVFVSVICVLFY